MIWLFLACQADDVDTAATYRNVALLDDTGLAVDSNTEGDSGSGRETGENQDGIVGEWLSEGDDRSTLFAPYFQKVSADFRSSGAYVVVATDNDGDNTTFEGEYSTSEGGDPAEIELVQSSPSNATSRGIYRVSGSTLTFETVIVTPESGYQPPTPEEGFGSSSGPQLSPGDNVQTYRRI